jgi:hypothetical protein
MNSIVSILILAALSVSPAIAKTKKSTPVSTASSSDATFFEKSKNTAAEAMDYVKEKSVEAAEKAEVKTNESVEKRKNYDYGAHLIYSPIDLVIPGKYGASVYMASEDKNSQYELQWVRGSYSLSLLSVDFGKIVDQRISLLKRNFSQSGNFNWYYGLSYITFEGTLGASILNTLPSGQSLNADLIDVQTLGLDLGFGHRWYFENNFSFSIDWLGISQPLVTLKKEAAFLSSSSSSQTDVDNVQKSMDLFAVIPRLYTLKVSLGYNF